MQCPECQSEHIRKNGKNRQGKPNYICADCHRQFIESYESHQGYSRPLAKVPFTRGREQGIGNREQQKIRCDSLYKAENLSQTLTLSPVPRSLFPDFCKKSSDDFRRECLKMYVNGTGFRGIERVKGQRSFLKR